MHYDSIHQHSKPTRAHTHTHEKGTEKARQIVQRYFQREKRTRVTLEPLFLGAMPTTVRRDGSTLVCALYGVPLGAPSSEGQVLRVLFSSLASPAAARVYKTLSGRLVQLVERTHPNPLLTSYLPTADIYGWSLWSYMTLTGDAVPRFRLDNSHVPRLYFAFDVYHSPIIIWPSLIIIGGRKWTTAAVITYIKYIAVQYFDGLLARIFHRSLRGVSYGGYHNGFGLGRNFEEAAQDKRTEYARDVRRPDPYDSATPRNTLAVVASQGGACVQWVTCLDVKTSRRTNPNKVLRMAPHTRCHVRGQSDVSKQL